MTNPGFLWMPRDWLSNSKVRAMTLEERAIYFDLLCQSWLDDGLPDDVDELARIVGVDRIRFGSAWERIRRQFAVGADGKLRNPRLESEREKQVSLWSRRSEAAKVANAAKAERNRIRIGSESERNVVVSPAPAPAPAPFQKTPSESPPTPKRSKPEPVPFPTALDVPDFLNALHEYESSRRSKHKPAGLRALLKRLEPFGAVAAAAALRESTANGWLGVFPESSNGRNGYAGGHTLKNAEGLSPEVAEGVRIAEVRIAERKRLNGVRI